MGDGRLRALVIGGTGFISGRLVDFLLEAGHDVAVVTRGKSRRRLPESVEHLTADRDSRESLAEAVRGRTFDVVYDIIAYAPEQSRTAVDVFREKTARFIHCSTISVYMVSEAVRCPVTEDQAGLPLMPYWPRNPFGMEYGIQKRACEDVLREAHSEGTFDVSMLRPTFVCGPHDPTARDWFWIQRILDGGPLLVPGSGEHAFQIVYVDDVARAFARLAEAGNTSAGCYNVTGEDILTLNEYLIRLAALLGREVELVHVDQEVFDRLPFCVHPRGDVFPFNTRRTAVFSLDLIKRDLGFRSTPFESWMQRTAEWYLKEHTGDSLGYDRRKEEVDFAARWRRAIDELVTPFSQP